jgi:hypothetical protein
MGLRFLQLLISAAKYVRDEEETTLSLLDQCKYCSKARFCLVVRKYVPYQT